MICSASSTQFFLGALLPIINIWGCSQGSFYLLGYVVIDTLGSTLGGGSLIRPDFAYHVHNTHRYVSFIGTPLDMACGIAAIDATGFIFQSIVFWRTYRFCGRCWNSFQERYSTLFWCFTDSSFSESVLSTMVQQGITATFWFASETSCC